MLSRKVLISLLAGAAASLALPPLWHLSSHLVSGLSRSAICAGGAAVNGVVDYCCHGYGLVHRVNPLDRAFIAGW